MAAKNKGLSNPYVKVNRRKRIGFNFSDKHKRYIKNCVNSTYNILEGAVRSGKTVDNVFAFAHELKTTKDRICLLYTSPSPRDPPVDLGCNPHTV